MPPLQEKFIHEEEEVDHPVRYLPIRHLYSSTTPCVSSSGSSNVVSKKVKARRLMVDDDEGLEEKQLSDIFHGKIRWGNGGKQILVYRRRLKKPREMRETEDPGICITQATKSGDFSDADLGCDMLKENEVRSPEIEANGANLLAEGNSVGDESRRRSRRRMKLELLKLGAVLDEPDLDAADSTRRRRSRRILSENKIALENPGNTSLLVVKSENFTVQSLENDNNKDERDGVMIGNDENLLITEGESIGNESKRHCSRSNFEPLYVEGVLADLDGNAAGETRRRSRRLLKNNKNALENSGNSEALILKCEIELENDKNKSNEDRDKSTVGSVVNILVSEEDSAGDLSHRNRWRANIELRNLGVVLVDPHGDVAGEFQRRGSQRLAKTNPPVERKISFSNPKDSSDFRIVRRWVGLDIEGTDPYALVGLACKIFWPMDDDWYKGSILSYDSDSHQHHIKYSDGDEEHLIVADEKMQFNVSSEEIRRLNLKKKEFDHYEMLSLAVISEDCDVPEPGDVVWAKLTGHSKWPALIVNEPGAAAIGLKREQSFFVQFFGTHNFARVGLKQVMPFGKGVHCSLDLKCKHGSFIQSLNEVKLYLSNQQLPERMLQVQKDKGFNLGNVASDENEEGVSALEDSSGDEVLQFSDEYICLPIEIGNLRVTSLGRIVHDSVYFHRKHNVWPEGYTAYRKFVSMIDPSRLAVYKMEVLRNPKSLSRPLFRVTTADGEQIDGSNPTACWKEVYERLRSIKGFGSLTDVEGYDLQKSGTYMFGFSTPLISKYIQGRLGLKNVERLPAGYRAVRIEWKDLDRCNVCHMDEEYEGNLFLQCDNCRMMVHARCYGEFGPMDGELWQCKLCRNGAPRSSPVCCLCPVIGGAMKPTTDGQWAHLACAIWIPETCLSDVKKMEPIDGVNRIHKDRWKLLCSICHVTYGACIQCSNSSCCTAYHPLCARAAGYCVELEDEDKIHLMSLDDDDDQCIRLISFCKKHSPPPSERIPFEDGLTMLENPVSSYVPPANVSGCARTEPFNFARRGYKAPHILTATSSKRLYVENRPYLVTGYCQNGIASGISCNKFMQTVYSSGAKKSKTLSETSTKVSSMYEKYESMRSTYRTRLSFGKSRIHGFGVFAKLPHRAGDMVIEYSGELVRPSIADIREHCIYNSLVGAGTYMFRIDNNRVIDATKAGSIAHLINHSCEPNCYSRVISVNGDEHIIIFAKRDISQWEELAYDYRFFSKDELACCCGFSRCRGIVNDLEERILKIEAPRSDLKSWDGE